MTVVIGGWLRRFKQSDKLQFLNKFFDYPRCICYNVIMKIMRFCRFLEE